MADDTAELIQRILAEGRALPSEFGSWAGDVGKTALNVAKLPIDIGADVLRNISHLGFGNRPSDPLRYTSGTYNDLNRSTGRVLEPAVNTGAAFIDAWKQAQQAQRAAGAQPIVEASPTVPGALPAAIPAMGDVQGTTVLPPAVARVPRVSPRTGAQNMGPQAQANALEGAIPPQATPVAAPVAPPVAPVAAPVVPKSTLVEEYSKALEKLKTTDTSGRLTAEQQYRSELSFWLNMLAAASEPGARAGGAIGKAGAAALEGMTKQETENKKAAMEMLKSNKEDVYRIAMLGDKEADNARELERIGITKEHYKVLEDNDKAKIGLLTKQLTMGGDEVKSAPILKNGNIGLITNSGKITDTGVKARVPHEADTRGEMEKTLASLRKNFPTKTKTEQELFDTYIGVKTAGKEERDRQDELVNKAVVDMLKDPMFRGTAAEARARVLSGMPGAQAVGLLRFNTLEEARAAKKAGKIKAGDTIMTPTGPIVVQ